MTTEEALNFIHERTWLGTKPGLSRTRRLLDLLGSPQSSLGFIHVAGTNGKGSTSAMLSAVLCAAGIKTGLYTSPYISCFNERMQVNGEFIDDALLGEITEKIAPLALSMEDRPTEFELVTAIAMEFFHREKCDIVVLEAGLGGRLDSTNVIDAPLVSVITNIGLDHTRELGETETIIAAEKAGIIKQNCPTAIYDLPPEVANVIKRKCAEMSSPLTVADFSAIEQISDGRNGQVFSYKGFKNLFLPLLGAHQLKNAAVALETVALLRAQGIGISDAAVKKGLENTHWHGRFEIISESPFFVLDGGHNPQGAETVAKNMQRYFSGMKSICLFGVLEDKDYAAMAQTLAPVFDIFITISPPLPRALPATALAKVLENLNKPVFAAEAIAEGIEKALSLADENSIICAVGSLYSVGAIGKYFKDSGI